MSPVREVSVPQSDILFPLIALLPAPGGGKTTQVKILAGEIKPTAGEVVKSSKDLRVAFLRQEFVDELVMERSLKEELSSVFIEENAVLSAIATCEVRVLVPRYA